ncbi:ABC transporter substrate-binding protein [Cellulomonas marina]|uniref:Multiple sugar transport system substrate-binding protein n=1 Tax=Cellulomonas marina TaxID=988821 RepID=A0A1I1AK02_9CELL|nr:sugar ABC transporter substrate-binding protein [Cellulomonas marina]GIG30162.1 sugar ABC transporter substrate-binding protein [Cellulomonas marina]SFB38371.1 multiple sugar transport system substrate-binding protein [Cellulomonas marina]
MKRRIVQGLAATAATALLLGGCGSGGEAAADETLDPDAPVTLTVSVWNLEGTPEFGALFDAYEAAHPNVTIEPVDILADDYPTKVTTMLAGGDSTDVITMKNVIDYARYATNGQLADVSDLAEETSDLAGLDAFDQDGSYFALPYRQDFWVLFYNKAIFDAVGEEYPTDLTWDEYAELAERITEEAAAAGVTPAEGQTTYGTYQHTWRSTVQAIADAQTDGDQLSGDYEFFAPYYERALELQDAGATLDFSTASTQKISYRTMFTTGQAAMLPMGSWFIAGLLQAEAAGETDVDWGIAPMPQAEDADEVTTFGSPTAFAVNKNAENSAAARDFVAWAASEEGAKAITAIGVVPSLQSDAITEAYFALEGMPTDETSRAAFEPDEVALEMPVAPTTSQVDQILNEEHQNIMTGSVPLEDALATMADRVQNEVG